MKSLLLSFLLIANSVLANEIGGTSSSNEDRGVNYNRLTQRFVTSVKEAQIEQQFRSVPQVQDCIQKHKVEKDDLNGPDRKTVLENIAKIQKEAADCVRKEMEKVDENKLLQLSKSLELDSFGIVKGQNAQEVIDYFSGRLQKALYGVDETKKPVRLNEQKMVDQKVFFDLYETQVGKNILLEISRYCQSVFDPKTGPNGTNKYDQIIGLKNLETDLGQYSRFTDKSAQPVSTSSTSDDDEQKIYQDFMNNVAGNGTSSQVKLRLTTLFDNCSKVIPVMCEMYEFCLCKKNNSSDPAACTNTRFSSANFSCPSEFKIGSNDPISNLEQLKPPGQTSCHVVARLRGYRTNLQALVKTKDQLKELQDLDGINLSFGKGRYDGRQAKDGESIDDLTSLTSSDAAKIAELNANKKYREEADKINEQECANSPEDPKCADFFYRNDESVNFANATVGFSAATAVEVERIKKLTGDDLEKYLQSKGYLDLIEKIKGTPPANESDIVEAAKKRFEAEREATFNEMNQAFARKQIVGERDKVTTVTEVKERAKNESKEFQNLLLFNNVVSSYLNIKKKVGDKEEDAGINVKALERERKAYTSGEVTDPDTLKFFTSLTQEESKVQAGENPIVDINFLDAILGNKKALEKQKNTAGAGGG